MTKSIISASVLALFLIATGATVPAVGMSAWTSSPGRDSSLPSITLDDVALSGTITGAEFSAQELLVGIKQGDWRTLPEGGSFEVHQLPSDQVRVSDGTWSVVVDPLSVPAKFVASDGQVDFIIEGHNETGAAIFHTVSALRISELATDVTGWLRAGEVIPDGWAPLPGLPSLTTPEAQTQTSAPQLGDGAGTDEMEATDTSAAAVDSGELTGIPLEALTAPAAMPNDDGQTGDTSFLLARPQATDVSIQTTAPWNCREISGYRAQLHTTIATGYPIGGDASSLTYSSTMKTTSGSATSFGGAWKESGTETTTDGWGANFYQDTRKRSYRTGIVYGYYACYNAAGYYSYWVFPIKQPGAAYYNYLSSAPNWTRCQPVYNGITWKREQSSGNDYELSYGVKAKNYVGFEMFSRHGYSSSGKLRYHVTHGNKHVCGNNNSPGQAGKVQEKY